MKILCIYVYVYFVPQRHFPRVHLASYYRDSPEIPDGTTRLPKKRHHMINRDQSPP